MTRTFTVLIHPNEIEYAHVRKVDVPLNEIVESNDTESILEKIFYYGQNDIQPKPAYSVSVGDIIIYEDEFYHVIPFGFSKVKPNLSRNK